MGLLYVVETGRSGRARGCVHGHLAIDGCQLAESSLTIGIVEAKESGASTMSKTLGRWHPPGRKRRSAIESALLAATSKLAAVLHRKPPLPSLGP